MNVLHLLLTGALVLTLPVSSMAQPSPRHNLHASRLATTWDEGIPLGNGMLGALVWNREGMLHFSLDRADLWDRRPMKGLERKEFNYRWIYERVVEKDYGIVQKYFDSPYENEPAPTKIPGAALEFDTRSLGAIRSVSLSLQRALCEITWMNGVRLRTFVHATLPVGWFRFDNLRVMIEPTIVPPRYRGDADTSAGGSVTGDNLVRLGYPEGSVTREGASCTYRQQGWRGFSYAVNVRWKRADPNSMEGAWSISSHQEGRPAAPPAPVTTRDALGRGFSGDLPSHRTWWRRYWSASSVSVPDSLLERQWYLEQYKFGSASRRGAPPISLQAVWTADNGRIPPWKGDFHHDLNTQLSYWPCYSANHLEEGLTYLDHLDANRENYRRYTKRFFGTEGLAVPGVTTLDGKEMGGWTQYSCSPTVSSWLAHHFHLHWRYSMDTLFLRRRAYPWFRETAVFLEQLTVKNAQGFRKLPMGSSPEINNNDVSAWFTESTNYDLALMKFVFRTAAEMASALGRSAEAAHWRSVLGEFPGYALTGNNELMFAPSLAYQESHRHFSHLMAIHPLGLINWEDGDNARNIIRKTIAQLDSIGPRHWCGYSYAWLASLKARAKDGDGAAAALSVFARAFCTPNSFHVNGDQTKSGYSEFTYRPFTLEGNFAFAAGLQEMLLQSHAGYIEVFPAAPAAWSHASFSTLRAEGAFLVSARREKGGATQVEIHAERGGTTRLRLPFASWVIQSRLDATVQSEDGFLLLRFRPNGNIILRCTARETDRLPLRSP